METGKLTREATWEDMSEVMRGVAEEVVGRESKTNDIAMSACVPQGSPVEQKDVWPRVTRDSIFFLSKRS